MHFHLTFGAYSFPLGFTEEPHLPLVGITMALLARLHVQQRRERRRELGNSLPRGMQVTGSERVSLTKQSLSFLHASSPVFIGQHSKPMSFLTHVTPARMPVLTSLLYIRRKWSMGSWTIQDCGCYHVGLKSPPDTKLRPVLGCNAEEDPESIKLRALRQDLSPVPTEIRTVSQLSAFSRMVCSVHTSNPI